MKKTLYAVLFSLLIIVGCKNNDKKEDYTITYSNPAPSMNQSMAGPQVQQQQQVPSQIIYPTQTEPVIYENNNSGIYTIPAQQNQVYSINDISVSGNENGKYIQTTGRRDMLGFKVNISKNPAGYWWNITWSCTGDTSTYNEIVMVDKATNSIVGVGNIMPRGARQGGFNIPIELAPNPNNIKVIIR